MLHSSLEQYSTWTKVSLTECSYKLMAWLERFNAIEEAEILLKGWFFTGVAL